MDTDPPPTPPTPARIIARRATDLFAISLVTVCGLTAGREIIHWWRSDAAAPSAGPMLDPQFEWSQRPLRLKFGSSPISLDRAPLLGNRDAAEEQLIRLARSALAETGEFHSPPTAEETEWLAALTKLAPDESSPELGDIYRVPGLLPSVAAVKTAAAIDADGGSRTRLVAWGMAMPKGDHAWTLLMFHPADGESETSVAGPELPSGASTLIAWADERGNRVTTFQGLGDLVDWLNHFDRQFGPQNQESIARDPTSATAQWRTADGNVDLQLSQRHGEEITGLLWRTATVHGHNGDSEIPESQILNSRP